MVDGSSNTFTRRKFLVGSVGSGVIMAFAAAGLSGCSNAPEQLAAKSYEPTLWFTLNSDGRITVYISEAEMGQHVGTALARIVAEELEADWNLIDIVHVDSDPKWGYRVTGGSWSVFHNFVLLSRAGAAGRVALIEAGATLMSADAADCIARNGRVIHGDESLSYGDIVARGNLDRTFTDEELEALPLNPPASGGCLGKTLPRSTFPTKPGVPQNMASMYRATAWSMPGRYCRQPALAAPSAGGMMVRRKKSPAI